MLIGFIAIFLPKKMTEPLKMNMRNNYGILSDLSKAVNCQVFDDCSERTVSQRTTTGFMKAIGWPNNSNQSVVHGAMLTSAYLLTKKAKQPLGVLLLVSLVLAYHNG